MLAPGIRGDFSRFSATPGCTGTRITSDRRIQLDTRDEGRPWQLLVGRELQSSRRLKCPSTTAGSLRRPREKLDGFKDGLAGDTPGPAVRSHHCGRGGRRTSRGSARVGRYSYAGGRRAQHPRRHSREWNNALHLRPRNEHGCVGANHRWGGLNHREGFRWPTRADRRREHALRRRDGGWANQFRADKRRATGPGGDGSCRARGCRRHSSVSWGLIPPNRGACLRTRGRDEQGD